MSIVAVNCNAHTLWVYFLTPSKSQDIQTYMPHYASTIACTDDVFSQAA